MTRRGLVLFGLMSVIWGIPYLFIRVAVAEITPATLVLARTALATAILLPIALARVDLRPVLARWRWVVAFAAVEIAIPWVALGSAEQHLSSSLTGLLIAGVPLVGTAIALATGGADRLSRTGLVGLLVGLIGVAAIVGGDYATTDPTALLQIVVVVVGYAVGPAILARRLGGLPTVGVMALSLALCAVVYIPIAADSVADRRPVGERDRFGRDPGCGLHGRRLPRVRRPDRRDRARSGNGHHLRQSGRRRCPRRARPQRDVHRPDGNRFRARDPRLDTGDTSARRRRLNGDRRARAGGPVTARVAV